MPMLGNKLPDLLKAFRRDSDFEMKSTVERFEDGASMSDGVSGKLGIDTSYENTAPTPEASSRSQWPDGMPDLSLK